MTTSEKIPGKSTLWPREAYGLFVVFFLVGGYVVWTFFVILSWSQPGNYLFFQSWFNPIGAISLGFAWYSTTFVLWLFGRFHKPAHIPAIDALLLALYGTVGLAIIQTIVTAGLSLPLILLGINTSIGILAVWILGAAMGALLTQYGYQLLFTKSTISLPLPPSC